MFKKFNIKTSNREEMIDITHAINSFIQENNVVSGIAVIFIPHTTAAVTINENADPSVQRDIKNILSEIAPYGKKSYTHLEGNSDSHLKSSIVGCSITVIIENSKVMLGTWQSIFFCEFDGPRNREFWVKLVKC